MLLVDILSAEAETLPLLLISVSKPAAIVGFVIAGLAIAAFLIVTIYEMQKIGRSYGKKIMKVQPIRVLVKKLGRPRLREKPL